MWLVIPSLYSLRISRTFMMMLSTWGGFIGWGLLMGEPRLIKGLGWCRVCFAVIVRVLSWELYVDLRTSAYVCYQYKGALLEKTKTTKTTQAKRSPIKCWNQLFISKSKLNLSPLLKPSPRIILIITTQIHLPWLPFPQFWRSYEWVRWWLPWYQWWVRFFSPWCVLVSGRFWLERRAYWK